MDACVYNDFNSIYVFYTNEVFVMVGDPLGKNLPLSQMKEENRLLRQQIAQLQETLKEKALLMEDLRPYKDMYKMIFIESPIAMAIYSNEYILLEVNRAYQTLFDIRDDEVERIIGKKQPSYLVHEAKEKTDKNRFIGYEITVDFDEIARENIYQPERKGNLNLEVLITPLIYPGGEDFQLIQIRDITESKLAEITLRNTAEQLELIVDNVPAMLAYVDNQERFIYVNKNYADWYGYTQEELIGKFIHDLIKPDVYLRAKPHYQAVLNGQTVSFENLAYDKDGQPRYVRASFVPHFDEQGSIKAFFSLIYEITARKQAEQKVTELKDFYENILEGIIDGVWVTDKNDIIQYVNKGMALIAGVPKQKIIGMRVLQDFNEGTMKSFRPLYLQAKSSLTPIEYDPIQVITPVGRLTMQSGWLIPLLKNGEYDGILCTTIDVTEQFNLQAKMIESEKLAGIGTLAAGIAHELNSPLQVITGSSESLLKQLDIGENIEKERLSNNLEMIKRNGWRCAEIVRSLLIYARLAEVPVVPSNLNEIVYDTLLLIEHQLKTWSNIMIITDLAQNLPPLICDRNQIVQVLINLLTNACDAMPTGGEITIKTAYDDHDRRILLQVSDTGLGIPDEISQKIFDPFFTTKPPGKGTGLGLPFVLGILQSYGGEIKVNQASPHGTVFDLFFPESGPKSSPSASLDIIVGRYNKGKDFVR